MIQERRNSGEGLRRKTDRKITFKDKIILALVSAILAGGSLFGGQKILSTVNPGEHDEFEERLSDLEKKQYELISWRDNQNKFTAEINEKLDQVSDGIRRLISDSEIRKAMAFKRL